MPSLELQDLRASSGGGTTLLERRKSARISVGARNSADSRDAVPRSLSIAVPSDSKAAIVQAQIQAQAQAQRQARQQRYGGVPERRHPADLDEQRQRATQNRTAANEDEDEQIEQLSYSPNSSTSMIEGGIHSSKHGQSHGRSQSYHCSSSVSSPSGSEQVPIASSPSRSSSILVGLGVGRRGRRRRRGSNDSSTSSTISLTGWRTNGEEADEEDGSRPRAPVLRRSGSAVSRSFKMIVSTALESPSPVPSISSRRPTFSREVSSSSTLIGDGIVPRSARSVNSHILPPSSGQQEQHEFVESPSRSDHPRSATLPVPLPRSSTSSSFSFRHDTGPYTSRHQQQQNRRRPSLSSMFSSLSSERVGLPPAIGAAPLPIDLKQGPHSARVSVDSRRANVDVARRQPAEDRRGSVTTSAEDDDGDEEEESSEEEHGRGHTKKHGKGHQKGMSLPLVVKMRMAIQSVLGRRKKQQQDTLVGKT
ncbi:hypothetical protein A4X09_0g5040 [Tilletia walkeri]|uniref:Uncharacterized protein n=1 Tax=Tilletia walkeri TaxID=117179 RepID=A0A8X7T3B0_9BASI|nr:hypothetical protein A4X09_0g5040 [Tilletia walkeri]